jgi:hypothetical protein
MRKNSDLHQILRLDLSLHAELLAHAFGGSVSWPNDRAID